MRLCWAVYGTLDQPTGGYVYDRIVAGGLRARGDRVDVVDLLVDGTLPAHAGDGEPYDAIVGDALCIRELGPGFERAAGGTARVLLVHHLTSWELEHAEDEGLRAAEARAIAAAHRIVVTGDATGARLSTEYAGAAAGIDVVIPGADRLPRPSRPPRRDGVLSLLFVGSLIARKRLLLLLDAVEAVNERSPGDRPGLFVTLVGDGQRDPGHAARIAERIERSAVLRGCVRVAGVEDEEALARTMARSDALVLPSSLEGYGMVLTEALHAGLPVLVSRATALASGLAKNPAVLVFDDALDLARRLEALASDPERRAALHVAALATDLPRWEGTIEAFRSAITRAVAIARASDRAP